MSAWECAKVVVFWHEGSVVNESIHVDIVILPPRASKINSLASIRLELKLHVPSVLALVPLSLNDHALCSEGSLGPWYSEVYA